MLTPSLNAAAREKRTQACLYGQLFIGSPYFWGGDDPMEGFDCSGIVCEILQSVGILKHGSDYTADALYNLFKTKPVDKPEQGCLVFWGKPRKTHVEMIVFKNNELCQVLGASGGGSKTISLGVAKKQNAFIKIRPLDQKLGYTAIVDPFA